MKTFKKQKFDKILCQLILPYAIRVPEEHFKFPDKEINVDLLFRRHSRQNPYEQISFDTKNQIIEKERFGRYDYSSVDIILSKKYFYYSPITDVYQMRLLALSSVRKFVQFYKLTHDEYWLIEPSINDIISFNINCYNNDEILKGETSSFLITPDRNRLLSFSSYLKEKKYQRDEMMIKLSSNFNIPIYTKLMMQGNRLYFEESYDLAVILFDRSFESFFDILVKVYLLKNNLFEQQWEKYIKMDLVSNNKKKSKLFQYSALVSKTGEMFYGTNQHFQEWRDNCRSLRNDIIHGKKSNINNDEAYKAMSSARKAFNFFNRIWYDLIVVGEKYYNPVNNKYHREL